MPRQPLAAVMILGAVLGALVASASAAYTTPSAESVQANRGWDAPPSDVFDRLDGS